MGAPLCGAHHLGDLAELSQPGIEQRYWVIVEPDQLPALADLLEPDPAPFEVVVQIQIAILPADHSPLLDLPHPFTVVIICFLPPSFVGPLRWLVTTRRGLHPLLPPPRLPLLKAHTAIRAPLAPLAQVQLTSILRAVHTDRRRPFPAYVTHKGLARPRRRHFFFTGATAAGLGGNCGRFRSTRHRCASVCNTSYSLSRKEARSSKYARN